MKKIKKTIIIICSIIIFAIISLVIFNKYFYDKNSLSINEKEWINEHKTDLLSFNIPSELNIFAKEGKGVLFDFLAEFGKANSLKINKNITPITGGSGIGFVVSQNINDKDLLLYQDHYVAVSKNYSVVSNIDDLNGKSIGGLSEHISRINSSMNIKASFTTYNSKEELINNLNEEKITYILVPLNEYIDVILKNNLNIVYHLDSIVNNYYIRLGDNETFNSIVVKFYNNWQKERLEDSYYDNLYNLFIEKLGLTELDIENLTSKTYSYGFINSTPLQTLNSSKYGGTILSYLEDFSKFSNVDFVYTKYKNSNDLANAFNNKKIDLLFKNISNEVNGIQINTNLNEKFYIISPLTNNLFITNLKDINETIYVLKDSTLSNYLKSYNNLKIEYVKNENKLIGLTRKNKIIALNADTYNYYTNKKIKDYYISYEGRNTNNYSFKYQNTNDTFYKLFSNYINYLSYNHISHEGYLDYKDAELDGKAINVIAKYILVILSLTIAVLGIVISSKKRIKLSTKIRKDEKLKFVDMLTSLKNRNYLNERIKVWNQNTIYPQAVIIIDLNNIKYLNDTFGHIEGDKQIMAAANILHQTQIDNTEIIRTDGNEFMIYLVGYNEKAVVNYMKKLVKEFASLPYEYGAAFGFSMIVDDLKLLDDAINEATIQMRGNKQLEAQNEETEE